MDQRWNLNSSSLTAIAINYKDITTLNKENGSIMQKKICLSRTWFISAGWLQDPAPL